MHKHIFKWLPGLLFVLILCGFTATEALSESKTYSAVEKRELQTCPKPTVKTIKNGKFQKRFETYLSDQFPQRDRWVSLQTDVSLLAGKKEINGVYFGKDKYLLEHYTKADFDAKQLNKNLKALAAFVDRAKADASVHVMMVPTKSWTLRAKLPAFAPHYEESAFFAALHKALGKDADSVLIPVEEVMQNHAQEAIYYRTDHHWTTLGAWYGYEAYTKAVGNDRQQALAKKQFRCVSKNFYGTTYAKVNRAPKADEIWLYEPKKPLQVIYNMGEKTTQTLYDHSCLNTTDQYRVFTGGNQAVLTITGGAENGKTLLLIKDSFANSMLPFLSEDYEKVVVVDMRMLNIKGNALLQMFTPTDILILYNSAQFSVDTAFAVSFR